MLTETGIVSIISIAIYVPCLFLAAFLLTRHGFTRSGGWIFVVLFTLIRVVGSALELSIDGDKNIQPNTEQANLNLASQILQSVGLVPLLSALMAFLGRIDDVCSLYIHVTPQVQRALHTTQIPLYVGLILAIVGSVNSEEDLTKDHVYNVSSLTQAGQIIILLCWVTVAAVDAFLIARVRSFAHRGAQVETSPDPRVRRPANPQRLLPVPEEFLLAAVSVSLVLLFVRILYMLISVFANSATFNLVTGSETARLCMSVIEEYAIVILLLAVGVTLKQLPKIDKSTQEGEKSQTRKVLGYVPFVHWFVR